MSTIITGINARGLKLPLVRHKLDQLTLVIGPVGSGKSSISDAIQFAALGYVPRVGKTEAATARLMNGPLMTAHVELSSRATFGRGLEQHSRKLVNTAEASWLAARAKSSEIGGAIRSLFGETDDQAAENLDISRLLAVSGAELAKRIEVLLDSGGLSLEARVRHGLEILNGRLEAGRENVDGMLMPLDPRLLAALEEAREDLVARLGVGIVPTIQWVSDQKLAAGEKSRKGIAARSILETRLQEINAPAEAEGELRAKLDGKTAAQTTIRANYETWAKAEEARNQWRRTIEIAQLAVNSNLDLLEKSRAAANQKVPALRAEADAIVDPPEIILPEPVQPDPAELAHAESLESEAQAIVPPPPNGACPERIRYMGEEEERLRAAEVRLDLAKHTPWREVETLANQLISLQVGVYDIAHKLLILAKQHGESVFDCEERVRICGVALEKRQAEIAARDAEIAAWEKERARREAEVAQLLRLRVDKTNAASVMRAEALRKAREANDQAMRAYKVAEKERRAIVAKHAETREALRAQADDLLRAVAKHEQGLKDAQAALAAAEARLAGLNEAQSLDPAAVQTELIKLDTSIAVLRRGLAARKSFDALQSEMHRIIESISASDVEHKLFSEIEWSMKRLRDIDMEQRSGKLEGDMRRFLVAAGRHEEPFLRCSKGAAEFGWRAGDREVAVDALSCGQSVIFRTALAYAVLMARVPEVRVLTIELAETGDGETDLAVLRGCQAVSADVQVIACTCVPLAPPEGWSVIDVAAPEREEMAHAFDG